VAAGIPRPFWNGQQLTFDETKARGPIDEAILQMWKDNLGVDVQVQQVGDLGRRKQPPDLVADHR